MMSFTIKKLITQADRVVPHCLALRAESVINPDEATDSPVTGQGL